jgi:hypothetical protein
MPNVIRAIGLKSLMSETIQCTLSALFPTVSLFSNAFAEISKTVMFSYPRLINNRPVYCHRRLCHYFGRFPIWFLMKVQRCFRVFLSPTHPLGLARKRSPNDFRLVLPF